MKKSVALNRKLSRMIAKNLIVLLTLVVVGCVGIFSWFTQNTSAKADGVQIKCEAPDGLEIAVVEHGANAPADNAYNTGTITLSAENYEFLSELSLTEITSDGKTFLKPMLTQSNGVANPDLEADWVEAEQNLHYLSFDLYVRCKSTQKVVLDSSSKFSTVSTTLTGENAGNISSSGEFSRDCVVGASRFSILSETNERELLWIPRPDIELKSTDGEFSVITNYVSDISKKHYYYEYKETTDVYEKQEMDSSKITVSTKGATDTYYHLPRDIELVTLGGTADDNGYYVKHVVCNMWIDGDDPEARLALVGGQFKIDLKLALSAIN